VGVQRAFTARPRRGTVSRGLTNIKIQTYLTAAAINLKRLSAVVLALFAKQMGIMKRKTPQLRRIGLYRKDDW